METDLERLRRIFESLEGRIAAINEERAKFESLFTFKRLIVKVIDPESALVSKAVKAPQKNKQLIREAIASERFPNLMDRIIQNGGKLENFV